MMVTIDRLGRIVVPKPVRDALSLVPGTRLELVEEPDGIRLLVPTTDARVEEVDGLPLIVSRRPEPLTDHDVDGLLDETRPSDTHPSDTRPSDTRAPGAPRTRR